MPGISARGKFVFVNVGANKGSPRARIYFFVFVVHTMSTMAGAMQFSRG
jgi:hypothetical protein